jgi:hypothetical protein
MVVLGTYFQYSVQRDRYGTAALAPFGYAIAAAKPRAKKRREMI